MMGMQLTKEEFEEHMLRVEEEVRGWGLEDGWKAGTMEGGWQTWPCPPRRRRPSLACR